MLLEIEPPGVRAALAALVALPPRLRVRALALGRSRGPASSHASNPTAASEPLLLAAGAEQYAQPCSARSGVGGYVAQRSVKVGTES